MSIKFDDMIRSCRRSKLAYTDNINIRNLFKNSKFYNGNKHDAQAFLHYSNNKIYTTFRGTMGINDWKDVIDIRHEKMFANNIKVHKGLHSQFFSIEEQITDDINAINKSYQVDELVFEGHSSAGSLALLASPFYDIMFNKNTFNNKKFKIKTFTFGSVSAGNYDFVKLFMNHVDEYYRIENYKDIVPRIPIHESFYHIPNPIILYDDGHISKKNELEFMNYKDILFIILKEGDVAQLKLDHSCDVYQKNILRARIKYNNDFANIQ